jgi:hypothetical protein
VREIAEEKAKVAKLEAEKYADAKISGLETAVVRLSDQLGYQSEMTKRDTDELRRWCDCKFIPMEKGKLDGGNINWHGVDPRLRLKHGDDRFKHCACGCNCEE